MAKGVDPASLSDVTKLRILQKNARSAGEEKLALECLLRIAELAGNDFDDPIEKEFWQAVTCAEEFKTAENGKTTRLSRTRQKYKRVGALQCVADWAEDSKITDGFEILIRAGRPDLTGEAIVLRHPEKFSEGAVAEARKKLLAHDVDLEMVLKK